MKTDRCIIIFAMLFFVIESSAQNIVNYYKDKNGVIVTTMLTPSGLAVMQGGHALIFNFYAMTDSDYIYYDQLIGTVTLSTNLKKLAIVFNNPPVTLKYTLSNSPIDNFVPQTSPTQNIQKERHTCPRCNGSGVNPYAEDVAAYGLTEEKWCDICRKMVPMSHGAHLRCPRCNGKGYIE